MKKSSGGLHSGLSNKSPKAVDASMACKGGSVDKDTTRDSTAKTPSTIGGRCA
jgi:hypothetical protein